MKPGSAKAKARRLQNKIAEAIRQHFNLSENDVQPAVMGETGSDIKLSDFARECFPYAIECKNTERLRLYDALDQAGRNANGLTPLLIFSRNRGEVYGCVKWDDFLTLF
jgi:hypothetical protein